LSGWALGLHGSAVAFTEKNKKKRNTKIVSTRFISSRATTSISLICRVVAISIITEDWSANVGKSVGSFVIFDEARGFIILLVIFCSVI
jgi:hypothetical protein